MNTPIWDYSELLEEAKDRIEEISRRRITKLLSLSTLSAYGARKEK